MSVSLHRSTQLPVTRTETTAAALFLPFVYGTILFDVLAKGLLSFDKRPIRRPRSRPGPDIPMPVLFARDDSEYGTLTDWVGAPAPTTSGATPNPPERGILRFFLLLVFSKDS